MAPKRNLSPKMRALSGMFSTLFQIFGVRKGSKMLLPSKLQKVRKGSKMLLPSKLQTADYEAAPLGKPCFATEVMHGAGNDSDEDKPLAEAYARDIIGETEHTALAELLTDKKAERDVENCKGIGGNIYRATAFQLYSCKEDTALVIGAFVIFIIQLFAPLILLTYQLATIDWGSLGTPTKSDDFYLESTQDVVYMLTTALAGGFYTAIVIWAYTSLGSAVDEWAKVYFSWHESLNGQTDCAPGSLLLGAFMNQYVMVMNVIITGLMFLVTDSPMDIVMNSLALQFLVTLDDFGGGFDFIPEMWDPEVVGELFFDQAKAYAVRADMGEQIAKSVDFEGEVKAGSAADVHKLFDSDDITSNVEEVCMWLAFENEGSGVYPSYFFNRRASYVSRFVVVLAYIAYIVLSSYGLQTFPSAVERSHDVHREEMDQMNKTIQALQLQLSQLQLR